MQEFLWRKRVRYNSEFLLCGLWFFHVFLVLIWKKFHFVFVCFWKMKLLLSYHHLYRVFIKFIPWSKSVEIESNLAYWKVWDFFCQFFNSFFLKGGGCSWTIYCCRVFVHFWCWNVDVDRSSPCTFISE